MDAMEDISDSESGIWENSSLNALLFATIPGVANRRNPKMPAATRLYPGSNSKQEYILSTQVQNQGSQVQ